MLPFVVLGMILAIGLLHRRIYTFVTNFITENELLGSSRLVRRLNNVDSSTMTDSRNAKGTVTADLSPLLDAGDGAVVTLVAGETQLAAHRAVLAARSPVFEAMFGHDMLEASSGTVTIPDVEGSVLRQLLTYCYTLQAPQLPSMADQMLAVADKYGLSALKAECEEQLATQLTVETAAAAAVLAVRHSCASLSQAAIAFIKANLVQVMATQGWADAVRSYPEDVVEVSRLLAEPPAKTSAPGPAAAASSPSGSPGTQATSAASAPRTASRDTPAADGDTASRYSGWSEKKKNEQLIRAAEDGKVRKLQEMLAAGADVGARDFSGNSALHLVTLRGRAEAVKSLLEAGAEVDARTRIEETPLHFAARYGHTEVVRLLVAASADLNARDGDGRTPLHLAIHRGHAEAAAALLEAGADRTVQDDWGDTPLDLATERNHQELVQMLAPN